MSKQCAICGKKSIMTGKFKKLMASYNSLPKRRKYPNLQWVKIPLNLTNKKFKGFIGKRIKACAKCIKTLSKTK